MAASQLTPMRWILKRALKSPKTYLETKCRVVGEDFFPNSKIINPFLCAEHHETDSWRRNFDRMKKRRIYCIPLQRPWTRAISWPMLIKKTINYFLIEKQQILKNAQAKKLKQSIKFCGRLCTIRIYFSKTHFFRKYFLSRCQQSAQNAWVGCAGINSCIARRSAFLLIIITSGRAHWWISAQKLRRGNISKIAIFLIVNAEIAKMPNEGHLYVSWPLL